MREISLYFHPKWLVFSSKFPHIYNIHKCRYIYTCVCIYLWYICIPYGHSALFVRSALGSCWGSGNKTKLGGVETKVIETVVLLKGLNGRHS